MRHFVSQPGRSFFELPHGVRVAAARCREVGRGLRDVRVAEPLLNRRQRHAGIHPARASLPPQIVKVQIDSLELLSTRDRETAVTGSSTGVMPCALRTVLAQAWRMSTRGRPIASPNT